jgi:hypothetical protein
VSDDALRTRVGEALDENPDIGGDATKRIVDDRRHRVIELWAEEKAKRLGIFNSVDPSPETVVEVCERHFDAPGGSYMPRWELVAAVVFGDASPRACREAIRLYEAARGPGSAKQRYVGRGSPPGPHRRPPNSAGT